MFASGLCGLLSRRAVLGFFVLFIFLFFVIYGGTLASLVIVVRSTRSCIFLISDEVLTGSPFSLRRPDTISLTGYLLLPERDDS